MARGRLLVAAALALLVTLKGDIGIQAPPVARASTTVGGASAQTPGLRVVSEDPYTNPRTYHRTEVEPDSFAFGSTIVATFQAGRSYRCGASNLGWSVSMDTGTTWTDGFLPGTTVHATPPGPWLRVTDPAIAYDAKHDTWLVEGLGARECPFARARADVFVSRSTDGAQTFDEPLIIERDRRGEFFDKNWIACDNTPTSPFYGNCYAAWTDFGDDFSYTRLRAASSSDGGQTWEKADAPKGACPHGVYPVIQPNGRVVVLFKDDCDYQMKAFISTDGGVSYRGPFALPATDSRGVRGHLAVPTFISADVDASGTVYAVWHDCMFRSRPNRYCPQNDIVMSTSANGRRWSDKIRIPIDPLSSSVNHFMPAIAVDPLTSGSSARLAVVYYFYPDYDCTVETCDLHVGFVSSRDGGATWASQQLAGPFKNTWFPLRGDGYFAADYISVSVVDGNAIPVFAVSSEGECVLGDITSCNVWTASATIALPPL